ncbi:MAG: hypothetical protein HOJ57_14775 [Lentisphaerae bacterium]|nr:hypothetical protein [Lentisphaerota bacterium]
MIVDTQWRLCSKFSDLRDSSGTRFCCRSCGPDLWETCVFGEASPATAILPGRFYAARRSPETPDAMLRSSRTLEQRLGSGLQITSGVARWRL